MSIVASMVAPAEKVLLSDDERLSRFADVPSESIEVVSAAANWVELLVSSTREAAEIAQAFVAKLETDLPHELINSIRQALRELLLNAVEWGGKLDPNQKVRIARLRYPRMLLYFVADPGAGFSFEGLAHAAVHQTSAEAIVRVAIVRDQLGMRSGDSASRWPVPLPMNCSTTKRRTRWCSLSISMEQCKIAPRRLPQPMKQKDRTTTPMG
jgi:anti-sigma regulatory factor (Ser/Thr protein kinase)